MFIVVMLDGDINPFRIWLKECLEHSNWNVWKASALQHSSASSSPFPAVKKQRLLQPKCWCCGRKAGPERSKAFTPCKNVKNIKYAAQKNLVRILQVVYQKDNLLLLSALKNSCETPPNNQHMILSDWTVCLQFSAPLWQDDCCSD